MKTDPIKKAMPVRELCDWQESRILIVNPEYQRGLVWTKRQKQLLIDSIMRGYPLPKIYLHKISKTLPSLGESSTHCEIIDGQQRIEAISEFSRDQFSLLDPKLPASKFPRFQRDDQCPWAGKTLSSLTAEDRERFLSFSLAVEFIETSGKNEPRDLFIRLQAGMPLNAQEKRDAWPGDMAEFIVRMAGKPNRHSGHGFFNQIKASANRGQNRQVAAQIVLLLLRRLEDEVSLADIKASALDDFYREYIDFDVAGQQAKEIERIFDTAETILSKANGPKIRIHTAIHLCLLIETLWRGFAKGWETQLGDILAEFEADLADATKASTGDFWNRYGQWARTGGNARETLERRDAFFSAYFLSRIRDLAPLDPQRGFSELERRIVFYRDKGICEICGKTVDWVEAEAHHDIPHSCGGPTELPNARLVHRSCHPRGPQAVTKNSTQPVPEIRSAVRGLCPPIWQMCRDVMAIGEELHYDEVTQRIKSHFPGWVCGLTPEASVRHDLNYYSDRHKSSTEAIFSMVSNREGYYKRIR